jgi:ferritin-like metal-binding protein YciE
VTTKNRRRRDVRASEHPGGGLQLQAGGHDWEVDVSPCPAIDGLQKEAKANVKKSDDSIVDAIILQGCVEVEHHEMGVYENLIVSAEALGRNDAVTVLKRNLESERSALQKVRSQLAEVAAAAPRQPA